MISQRDLPVYIQQSFPELSGLCKDEKACNIYRLIRALFKYTATQLTTNNKRAARQCLLLAEQMHASGNKAIKNAIENIYVYSFSQALFQDENKRKEFLALVPQSLYSLYKQQVSTSNL